jgi:16S rRNA (guanine527-N7)-methyltransferase
MPSLPAPPAAREIFGDAFPLAERYTSFLAGPGVERGLIGPREVSRLWDRHVLNCAVLTELIPDSAEVVDVGSGAGLPGIVLAIMRPDLSVTLLEPLLRRTVFLQECVDLLELSNVTVRRARAEEVVGEYAADVVTARAVAPLSRLAGWALPLLRANGELLALKGERAAAEIEDAQPVLDKFGVRVAEVVHVGRGKVDPPTTVVRAIAGKTPQPSKGRSGPRRGARRRGGAHGRKR